VEYEVKRPHGLRVIAVLAVLLGGLMACGDSSETGEAKAGGGSSAAFPVTIKHALGTATIKAKPERVATVNWANHEVPLALGVVPVGMAAANFGDDNGDGVLPWVEKRLKELGAKPPLLFD
jgi:iron complex transport system substrate-binding protein